MPDTLELVNDTETLNQTIGAISDAVNYTQTPLATAGREFLSAILNLGSASKNLAMAFLMKILGYFHVSLSQNVLSGVAIGVWLLTLFVLWSYAQNYFKYVFAAGVTLIILAFIGVI